MAYTPEQIKAEADKIIANGGNWQNVWDAASKYGVSMDQLAGSYGKTGAEGTAFAQQQGVITDAMAPAPAPATGGFVRGADAASNTPGAFVPGSSGLTAAQIADYNNRYAQSGYKGSEAWEAMDPELRAAIMSGNVNMPGGPFSQVNPTLTPAQRSAIPDALTMYGLPEGKTLEQALGGGSLPANYGKPGYYASGTGVVSGAMGGTGAAAPAGSPAAAPGAAPATSNAPAGQVSNQQIVGWLQQNGYNDPSVPYAQRIATIVQAQQQYGVSNERIAQALGEALGQPITAEQVQRYLSGQQDYFARTTVGGGTTAGSNGSWTTTSSGAAMLGDPTRWEVTPDQTVEGRIGKLIDPNNPLNVQISGQVADAWAGRGLVNSGMAVGAGMDAVVKNAMAIATPDAATYAKAAGYNADESNVFSMKNSDYENQFRLNKQQQDSQYRIAELNADTQKAIAQMDITAKQAADAIAIENKTLLETNAQAAAAFNTAASAISAIQNNDKMDAGTKTAAIANVWHDLQTQLRVLGSTTGLDLTSQLDFAGYPGFDDTGNWVGSGGPLSAQQEGGGEFPPAINGVAINWDAPPAQAGLAGLQETTLREAYLQYKAQGGLMTPREWVTFNRGGVGGGGGSLDAGQDANGSVAGGIAGDGVGSNANGDAAGVGAGPR